MSIKPKLEKSAKTLSRFSGLLGDALTNLLPITNANIYFHVTDGASYTLEIRKLAATVSEGRIEPITLELIGTTENFLEFFNKKRSFAEAWVNGKITVKGVRNNLLQALLVGMVLTS
ncbi:MAG: hypothetical protein ACTSRS_14890 [Candidatus Helarchaeota archaeon]